MSPLGSFEPIVDNLAEQGYSVSEGLLTRRHIGELASLALAHQAEGRMTAARTGKTRAENAAVRGDSITWLDKHSPDASVIDCLATFEALRLTLNEQLFMNLHEVESHFAIYPAGAVYGKHVDQFTNGPHRHPSRQLSLVLYLNNGWLTTNGGALRLYLSEGIDDHLDISPTDGRLVLFLSSRFWHEVLPADRERLSLTGWFRTRSVL